MSTSKPKFPGLTGRIVLYLERFLHVADVTVHAGNVRLKGLAKTDGMYASIDEAMGRIERPLLTETIPQSVRLFRSSGNC